MKREYKEFNFKTDYIRNKDLPTKKEQKEYIFSKPKLVHILRVLSLYLISKKEEDITLINYIETEKTITEYEETKNNKLLDIDNYIKLYIDENFLLHLYESVNLFCFNTEDTFLKANTVLTYIEFYYKTINATFSEELKNFSNKIYDKSYSEDDNSENAIVKSVYETCLLNKLYKYSQKSQLELLAFLYNLKLENIKDAKVEFNQYEFNTKGVIDILEWCLNNMIEDAKLCYYANEYISEKIKNISSKYNIIITFDKQQQDDINDLFKQSLKSIEKEAEKEQSKVFNTYNLSIDKVITQINDVLNKPNKIKKDKTPSNKIKLDTISDNLTDDALLNDSFSYIDLDNFSTKLTDTNININRGWVALNNTIDGREIIKLRNGIITFNKNNTKPLKKILDDTNTTKQDKEQAKALLDDIYKKRENAEEEIKSRKDNLVQLAKLEQEQGKTKEIDKLIKGNKRKIKELEKLINEPTLSLQSNFDNKLVYQKGKSTLMIPINHNIENITDIGNDLIMFIGNEIYHKLILKADKDVLQDDDTYINIDLDEWATFRGYEHRNYSVLRKEIAKELDNIFYEEYNIKGKIENGNNKGDYELKGRIISDFARITLNDKTTFKVSLGAFYRKTWENAILTGQIANIPTTTMQLGNKGSGKNVVDKAVKELAIYFRQLANLEKNKNHIHIDKKGLYFKDFKLSTLIEILREKDLIQQSNYKFINRVNGKMFDILERAMELKQFLYQTNAFDKYLDETDRKVKENIRIEHFNEETIRIYIDLSNDTYFNKSREIHQKKIKTINRKKT